MHGAAPGEAPDPGHEEPRPPHPPDHERLARLADAAIEAEFETGEREDTRAAARAHVLARLGRMTFGSVVVLVGVIMLPLPGPGWLVIAAGLVILSRDVAWAERTLARVRRRLPSDADGRIPKSTWFVIGGTTTLTVSASLWWTFLR